MRLVLTALFLFSIWNASVIFGSATLLRLNSSTGNQSMEKMLLARTIDREHPGVLNWFRSFWREQNGAVAGSERPDPVGAFPCQWLGRFVRAKTGKSRAG